MIPIVFRSFYLRKSALICGLILCLAVNASNNPLDVFLEELDTFSADFEQTLLDTAGEVLETTKGTVQLRRPGMFSWLYNEPFVQEIISDGKTLWVYDKDLDQVTISDVSDAIEDTPALIFSGNYILSEHYVINELESDEYAWVELTPRDIESHYRSLRLAFSGNELAAMLLSDSLGQTLFITFTNGSRNPDLNRELFRFTPAGNIDVIDARSVD